MHGLAQPPLPFPTSEAKAQPDRQEVRVCTGAIVKPTYLPDSQQNFKGKMSR